MVHPMFAQYASCAIAVLSLCDANDYDVNTTYITCTDASKLSTVSFLPVYQEQLAHMIRSSVGFKGEDYWSPLKGTYVIITYSICIVW
jgi:hypothetical protein